MNFIAVIERRKHQPSGVEKVIITDGRYFLYWNIHVGSTQKAQAACIPNLFRNFSLVVRILGLKQQQNMGFAQKQKSAICGEHTTRYNTKWQGPKNMLTTTQDPPNLHTSMDDCRYSSQPCVLYGA